MSSTHSYHKDVGFPDVCWPKGIFPLKYSRHALAEAANDRYGDVAAKLPQAVNMARCQVVEAQIENGVRIQTMVLRLPLDYRDLILVVSTTTSAWTVKTVFLNLKSDKHSNLNKSRYRRPRDGEFFDLYS